MMAKAPAIHIGDTVRIVRDKWIRRVGYRFHYKEVMAKFLMEPVLLWTAAEPFRQLGMPSALGSPATRELAEGLAKAFVLANSYGGPERSIHYRELTEDSRAIHIKARSWRGQDWDFHQQEVLPHVGKTFQVLDKYVCQTGKRVGTARGYDSYAGEYWEEKGYLEDRRTHTILCLDVGDIEACDVELVGKAKSDQLIPS